MPSVGEEQGERMARRVHVDSGGIPLLVIELLHGIEHGMTLDDQARIIRKAVGPTGSNRDYLLNTVSHLKALDIEDAELFALAEMVERG